MPHGRTGKLSKLSTRIFVSGQLPEFLDPPIHQWQASASPRKDRLQRSRFCIAIGLL